MKKFKGFVYSRIVAMGTKSAGEVCFLQTLEKDYYLVSFEHPPFVGDEKLFPFIRKYAEVEGEINNNALQMKDEKLHLEVILVHSIKEINVTDV